MGSWEDFYKEHLPPTDFEDNRSLLKEFCDRHKNIGSNIVLITVSLKVLEYLFVSLKGKDR